MLGLVNGLPRAKIYRQKMGGESLTRTDVAEFMAEILEICPLDPLN